MKITPKQTGHISGFIAALLLNGIVFGISSIFTNMKFGIAILYSIINAIWMTFILLPLLPKINTLFLSRKFEAKEKANNVSKISKEDSRLRDVSRNLNENGKMDKKTEVNYDIISEGYGKFGLEATNPIPVNTEKGCKNYLNRLRTLNGEQIKYQRIQIPVIASNIGKPIDSYNILAHGEFIAKLYICPFYQKNSEIPPEGFRLESLIEEHNAIDGISIINNNFCSDRFSALYNLRFSDFLDYLIIKESDNLLESCNHKISTFVFENAYDPIQSNIGIFNWLSGMSNDYTIFDLDLLTIEVRERTHNAFLNQINKLIDNRLFFNCEITNVITEEVFLWSCIDVYFNMKMKQM